MRWGAKGRRSRTAPRERTGNIPAFLEYIKRKLINTQCSYLCHASVLFSLVSPQFPPNKKNPLEMLCVLQEA